MSDQDITLKTVLDHMQHNHQVLLGKINILQKDVNNLKKDVHSLKERIDVVEQGIAWIRTILKNIDQRLDEVEIPIWEQKHEKRINALEKHTGLVAV